MHYWFKSYDNFAEKGTFPIGQSGDASWWRVCYQWGLLRLVYKGGGGQGGSAKNESTAVFFPCGFHYLLLFKPHTSPKGGVGTNRHTPSEFQYCLFFQPVSEHFLSRA